MNFCTALPIEYWVRERNLHSRIYSNRPPRSYLRYAGGGFTCVSKTHYLLASNPRYSWILNPQGSQQR